MEKNWLSGYYDYIQLTDVFLFMAQMNTITDLSLDSDFITTLQDSYPDYFRKRQEIKHTMTAFSSLKRISFGVCGTKYSALVSDIADIVLTDINNIL